MLFRLSKLRYPLALKTLIMTAADGIYKFFVIVFSGKIRLDVSSESCARIHMKNQALFSSNDKSKNLKCRLLQFLFGVLRIKFSHHSSKILHFVSPPPPPSP